MSIHATRSIHVIFDLVNLTIFYEEYEYKLRSTSAVCETSSDILLLPAAGFEHCPQHSFLLHPQSVFFPQSKCAFHAYTNYSYILISNEYILLRYLIQIL